MQSRWVGADGTRYLYCSYRFETTLAGRKSLTSSTATIVGRQTGGNYGGLYYTLHRHFDPVLMRWTSPDPATSPFYNLFGYCGNAPGAAYDPDGLGAIDGFVGELFRDGGEWIGESVFGGEGWGAGISKGVGNFVGGIADIPAKLFPLFWAADTIHWIGTGDFKDSPMLFQHVSSPFTTAYQRWNVMGDAGFGFTSKVGRTVAFRGMDIAGTTGLFEAAAGYDSVTQQDISDTERIARGTTFALNTAATLISARAMGGGCGDVAAPNAAPMRNTV